MGGCSHRSSRRISRSWRRWRRSSRSTGCPCPPRTACRSRKWRNRRQTPTFSFWLSISEFEKTNNFSFKLLISICWHYASLEDRPIRRDHFFKLVNLLISRNQLGQKLIEAFLAVEKHQNTISGHVWASRTRNKTRFSDTFSNLPPNFPVNGFFVRPVRPSPAPECIG